MKILKKIFDKWFDEGVRLPYAHDTTTGKPSITLLFAYTTFILTLVSAISLHKNTEHLEASIFSLVFWAISFVMYRMRRLDKFKIDIDDRSIELESEKDDEQTPS